MTIVLVALGQMHVRYDDHGLGVTFGLDKEERQQRQIRDKEQQLERTRSQAFSEILGKWSGIYESSLDTSYNEFCQPFGVRYSVDLVENNSSGTKTKGLRLRLDAFSSPHSSAPVTEEDRVACVAHLRQFISGNSQYHWHTDNLRAFLEFEGTVEFAEDSSDVFLSKLDESVCEGSCMGTAARFEIASTGSLRYNGPNFFPSDKGAVTVHLNKDKAVSP